MFERAPYSDLNSRQKENFNFHKVAACLADYGFNYLRLTDDWQGANFIACHINGDTFLKVHLKGRLVIDRKYQSKDIHVAFIHGYTVYLYDHARLVGYIEDNGLIGAESITWHEKGFRSWPTPPAWAVNFLEEFRI